MKAKSLQELVTWFELSVIAQTTAMETNDFRRGNRCADEASNAWRELRERGNEGKEALCVLLYHERPDVRGDAAACLLRYKTIEATAVLRQLASHSGLIGFGAQQCLARWEEGDWHLDDEE